MPHDDQQSQSSDAERLRQIFEERPGALLRFLRRMNPGRPHMVEDLLRETLL
ncbi:hypothetical protein [Micromonospora avicenniae]|uniref:Uncharacterized protein n=1 Tax=Micromonospora avicenniae TaxID=1198245 RepID=A0A1N7FUS3_9ACTN|nr:hypothetical protein [Micromonospora avicenniae]SIS04017.1 hypothetical protein SAMN05444858_1501 [Micromonospora avicenniae]